MHLPGDPRPLGGAGLGHPPGLVGLGALRPVAQRGDQRLVRAQQHAPADEARRRRRRRAPPTSRTAARRRAATPRGSGARRSRRRPRRARRDAAATGRRPARRAWRAASPPGTRAARARQQQRDRHRPAAEQRDEREADHGGGDVKRQVGTDATALERQAHEHGHGAGPHGRLSARTAAPAGCVPGRRKASGTGGDAVSDEDETEAACTAAKSKIARRGGHRPKYAPCRQGRPQRRQRPARAVEGRPGRRPRADVAPAAKSEPWLS